MSPPLILAKLDMNKQIERNVQAFILRACTGRSAMWRLLAMKRHGTKLFAVAKWLRVGERSFSVVEMSLTELAVCWKDYPTAAAARAALDALEDKDPSKSSPAAPALPEGGAP